MAKLFSPLKVEYFLIFLGPWFRIAINIWSSTSSGFDNKLMIKRTKNELIPRKQAYVIERHQPLPFAQVSLMFTWAFGHIISPYTGLPSPYARMATTNRYVPDALAMYSSWIFYLGSCSMARFLPSPCHSSSSTHSRATSTFTLWQYLSHEEI